MYIYAYKEWFSQLNARHKFQANVIGLFGPMQNLFFQPFYTGTHGDLRLNVHIYV